MFHMEQFGRPMEPNTLHTFPNFRCSFDLGNTYFAYTTVGKLKVRIFNVAAPSTRTACASHPTPETSS